MIIIFIASCQHQAQGGITPVGAVSRAATAVKMQSNGQGTSWGLVKQSSGVLGPISSIARWPRGMAAYAVSRLSTGEGQKFAIIILWSRPFLDGQKS